jgi:hypothetical protein
MLRGIGAWRRGGVLEGDVYVEPYVLGGLIDPDSRFQDDSVAELTAGVNVGMWRRVRVTLELSLTRTGGAPPDILDPNYDTTEPRALVDDEIVRLQVGASW